MAILYIETGPRGKSALSFLAWEFRSLHYPWF